MLQLFINPLTFQFHTVLKIANEGSPDSRLAPPTVLPQPYEDREMARQLEAFWVKGMDVLDMRSRLVSIKLRDQSHIKYDPAKDERPLGSHKFPTDLTTCVSWRSMTQKCVTKN